jgi:hypothetical protein
VKQSLLKSFVQAGFECSTHKRKNGTRLDLIASTGHDRFALQDFARLKEVGILSAREGIRWYLIEREPGKLDFSSVLPILEAAQKARIQILWDLLHFGWPDHLDVFSPEWVDSFGELASGFAKLMREHSSETILIAPVNEISFTAWAGGDAAHINPYEHNRGPEMKRQLVRAFVRASDALRSELSDLWLISPEPVIHIVGDPRRPDDVPACSRRREWGVQHSDPARHLSGRGRAAWTPSSRRPESGHRQRSQRPKHDSDRLGSGL